MADLKQMPGKTSAKLSKGLVQGKHPWFKNRPLRFGVARLPIDEQTSFLAEVQKLFQAAPRYRSEAPSGVRDVILHKYFDAIDAADTAEMEIVIDTDGRVDGISLHFDSKRDEALIGTYLNLKAQHALGRKKIEQLEADKSSLEAQVENLVRSSGERTAAERRTTIRKCWERFEERFRCRIGSKPEERDNVLRRVRRVLDQLGWDRTYASVEKADLEKAIAESGLRSETEKSKRTIDIKRFFKFLCRPKAQDGLGFINNPAETLAYLGPKALQRRRRARGQVKVADPETVLPKMKNAYWKALYATLCYAGLRLNEAASLTWDRILWDKRILTILPSAINPALKSDLSERSVKPFKELWPFLRAYEAEKFNERIVFPRYENHEKPWFYLKAGNARVSHLTRELAKALKAAGLTTEDAREPQRRARRYWETRMRSIGRTDMIEAMGGHTKQVGYDHYTNVLKVVEALEGKEF